eukprot:gnl/TRDRNA2_/TRDRNA2_122078_c0_seq1.p1 gnl/TRDRNA2_/TRDRNA2_122078_c0~~gnl/TRDRNA2_/TRDRNA2_122078_c0_seq1.p1  ORF type:complete len:972 (-),score=112.52 gnl/TRDRNA2_/TRDRNA2_122078_c0_seq1:153-2639(-)
MAPAPSDSSSSDFDPTSRRRTVYEPDLPIGHGHDMSSFRRRRTPPSMPFEMPGPEDGQPTTSAAAPSWRVAPKPKYDVEVPVEWRTTTSAPRASTSRVPDVRPPEPVRAAVLFAVDSEAEAEKLRWPSAINGIASALFRALSLSGDDRLEIEGVDVIAPEGRRLAETGSWQVRVRFVVVVTSPGHDQVVASKIHSISHGGSSPTRAILSEALQNELLARDIGVETSVLGASVGDAPPIESSPSSGTVPVDPSPAGASHAGSLPVDGSSAGTGPDAYVTPSVAPTPGKSPGDAWSPGDATSAGAEDLDQRWQPADDSDGIPLKDALMYGGIGLAALLCLIACCAASVVCACMTQSAQGQRRSRSARAKGKASKATAAAGVPQAVPRDDMPTALPVSINPPEPCKLAWPSAEQEASRAATPQSQASTASTRSPARSLSARRSIAAVSAAPSSSRAGTPDTGVSLEELEKNSMISGIGSLMTPDADEEQAVELQSISSADRARCWVPASMEVSPSALGKLGFAPRHRPGLSPSVSSVAATAASTEQRTPANKAAVPSSPSCVLDLAAGEDDDAELRSIASADPNRCSTPLPGEVFDHAADTCASPSPDPAADTSASPLPDRAADTFASPLPDLAADTSASPLPNRAADISASPLPDRAADICASSLPETMETRALDEWRPSSSPPPEEDARASLPQQAEEPRPPTPPPLVEETPCPPDVEHPFAGQSGEPPPASSLASVAEPEGQAMSQAKEPTTESEAAGGAAEVLATSASSQSDRPRDLEAAKSQPPQPLKRRSSMLDWMAQRRASFLNEDEHETRSQPEGQMEDQGAD